MERIEEEDEEDSNAFFEPTEQEIMQKSIKRLKTLKSKDLKNKDLKKKDEEKLLTPEEIFEEEKKKK